MVNSGAAETVIPRTWFPNHKTVESEGSKRGVFYTNEDGSTVENEGEETLIMPTDHRQRGQEDCRSTDQNAKGCIGEEIEHKNQVKRSNIRVDGRVVSRTDHKTCDHVQFAHEHARTVEGSSCGENSMRSGVEVHHRSHRCLSMQQLWEALPSWEQLGSEVLTGGYVVLAWVNAQALDKLVPQEHQSVIVSKPEIADYRLKLLWVKAQMAHARGATQAQQVSAATTPKWNRDGDVQTGAVLQDVSSRAANVQEPSLLSNRY